MEHLMKINHVAFVVPTLGEGHAFWHDIMKLPTGKSYREPEQGVDVAFYGTEESKIELVAPLDDESGVAKFLQKRGPGMHHICFEVPNLDDTLAELKSHQIELIDEVPRLNAKGVRVAFVHPKSSGGVLVEFYEVAENE